VVDLPLWKIWVRQLNSWDDEIPNIWKIKAMFQSPPTVVLYLHNDNTSTDTAWPKSESRLKSSKAKTYIPFTSIHQDARFLGQRSSYFTGWSQKRLPLWIPVVPPSVHDFDCRYLGSSIWHFHWSRIPWCENGKNVSSICMCEHIYIIHRYWYIYIYIYI